MSAMSQSPSTHSFDLSTTLINTSYSTLLSESISLQSTLSILSYSDFDRIPRFPPGCMIPMSTIIAVEGGPLLGSNCDDCLGPITTTVPTAPRLRTIFKEDLSIHRWLKNLHNPGAPGHRPWEKDVFYSKEYSRWKPEGSMYAPERFRTALQRNHQNKHAPSVLTETTDSEDIEAQFDSMFSRCSNRDALVFEREVMLKTDGEIKWWSLQTPASSMEHETVDMMLELKELNSHFGERSCDTTFGGLPTGDRNILNIPSLVVSNSEMAVPLSLDSSNSLTVAISSDLASRRGQRLPPPVRTDLTEETPYPGIPTAFLGIDSPYSPISLIQDEKVPQMSLQDMVMSLRSRGEALYTASQLLTMTPEDPVHENTAIVGQASTFALKSQMKEQTYANGSLHGHVRQDSIDYFDLPPADRGSEKGEYMIQQNVPSESCVSLIGSSVSSTSCPRGILKRSKNVRFASFPARKTFVVNLDRHPSLFSPPPVNSQSRTLNSIPQSSSRSLPKSTTQKSATISQHTSRSSTPSSSKGTSSKHKSLGTVSSDKSVWGPGSLSRTCTAVRPSTSKENKLPSPSAPAARQRLRASESPIQAHGVTLQSTAKHRLPMPLRNILTRIK